MKKKVIIAKLLEQLDQLKNTRREDQRSNLRFVLEKNKIINDLTEECDRLNRACDEAMPKKRQDTVLFHTKRTLGNGKG